jgi:broad specificity phosphatase PhoE
MVELLILARHAESVATVAHELNGDPARQAPLTAHGRSQARRMGDQLRHLNIDLAICTHHRRIEETARLTIEGHRIPLVVEPSFDELRVGDLEGHPFAEYISWRAMHRADERLPGGESPEEALRRYAAGLQSVQERNLAVVLLVCHGLPIRCILEAAGSARAFDPTRRSVALATPYFLDGKVVTAAVRYLTHFVAASSAARNLRVAGAGNGRSSGCGPTLASNRAHQPMEETR